MNGFEDSIGIGYFDTEEQAQHFLKTSVLKVEAQKEALTIEWCQYNKFNQAVQESLYRTSAP